MRTSQEIDTMNSDDLKANFFVLMADIVTEYGDNQEVICPGYTNLSIALPTSDDDQDLPVQCSQI